AMKQDYIETVRLLIDIAPDIFESPRLAMKGGTALNLFLQDMPRFSVDIFDVRKMYENFGLEASFVDCFVAYLAGHNRPVHEVLFSADAPFDAVYNNHFRGMTREEIALDT